MQHSNAVNEIETLGGKRKMKNICLEYRGLAAGQVARRDFRRQAQINANHVRSPARGYIRETPHPAAYVEHQFARQILRT